MTRTFVGCRVLRSAPPRAVPSEGSGLQPRRAASHTPHAVRCRGNWPVAASREMEYAMPTRAVRSRPTRRSFLTAGALAGGVAMLPHVPAFGQQNPALSARHPKRLPRGDAAILRFLAAAETIEADLWQQYNELAANN